MAAHVPANAGTSRARVPVVAAAQCDDGADAGRIVFWRAVQLLHEPAQPIYLLQFLEAHASPLAIFNRGTGRVPPGAGGLFWFVLPAIGHADGVVAVVLRDYSKEKRCGPSHPRPKIAARRRLIDFVRVKR